MDDSVQSLEKLAELHRRGDLSDAEFAEAKRGLLEESAAASPAPAAPVVHFSAPAPSSYPPPPPLNETHTTPATTSIAVAPARSARWGGGWKIAVIAWIVVGLVLGIAAIIIAEVAPSSAQWTKGLVCASGERLVTNGGVVESNGGSAQGATHFYCVPANQPVTGFELLSVSEKTGSVLGLSFLLGFLIAGVLTLIGVVTVRSRT
jgi:hypothetical protein